MFIGTKELSKELGIPEYSVRFLHKTGVIPAIVIGNGRRGGKILFDPVMVKEAIKTAMLRNSEKAKMEVEHGTDS